MLQGESKLLKILRILQRPLSSYLLKWAIHEKLKNTEVNSIEGLGPAIRRALTHRSIKGKFDGVSPLLKKHGYSRVIVTDHGFMFISDKERV